MSASKNRKCLLCGEPYHTCSSCGMPEWAWTYCTEECWFSSMKAMQCLALGDKLASLLEAHEMVLLKEAISEESHYLDRILDGLLLPRD
jgi:hypothetical protein